MSTHCRGHPSPQQGGHHTSFLMAIARRVRLLSPYGAPKAPKAPAFPTLGRRVSTQVTATQFGSVCWADHWADVCCFREMSVFSPLPQATEGTPFFSCNQRTEATEAEVFRDGLTMVHGSPGRFLYKTEQAMGGSLRWMAPEIATGHDRSPSLGRRRPRATVTAPSVAGLGVWTGRDVCGDLGARRSEGTGGSGS